MPVKKPGALKRLLSYVKEFPVETLEGKYTETLQVIYHQNRYMLNAPSATYSFEDLYSSFASAFRHIVLEERNMHSVLVLGLGLGSIPWLLQKKYGITCPIDCVEVDPTIAALAEKYYPDAEKFRNLNIHISDASEWIQKNTAKYDLITVDLFIDLYVPTEFHTEDFLQKLRSSVNKNGILLFSRLTANYYREKILWENMKAVFPEGIDIITGGNTILSWQQL